MRRHDRRPPLPLSPACPRYRSTTSRPNDVSSAPPPRLPPRAVSTTGRRKATFISSTKSHVRRYDISIARPAAEIDPEWPISSRSPTLPGPSRRSGVRSTRRLNAGDARRGLRARAEPTRTPTRRAIAHSSLATRRALLPRTAPLRTACYARRRGRSPSGEYAQVLNRLLVVGGSFPRLAAPIETQHLHFNRGLS